MPMRQTLGCNCGLHMRIHQHIKQSFEASRAVNDPTTCAKPPTRLPLTLLFSPSFTLRRSIAASPWSRPWRATTTSRLASLAARSCTRFKQGSKPSRVASQIERTRTREAHVIAPSSAPRLYMKQFNSSYTTRGFRAVSRVHVSHQPKSQEKKCALALGPISCRCLPNARCTWTRGSARRWARGCRTGTARATFCLRRSYPGEG